MNRRGFLGTILAAATAPAIIKVDALMRPRKVDFWDTLPMNEWVQPPTRIVPTAQHSYEPLEYAEGLVFPPRPINPFRAGKLFFCIGGEMVEVGEVTDLQVEFSEPATQLQRVDKIVHQDMLWRCEIPAPNMIEQVRTRTKQLARELGITST